MSSKFSSTLFFISFVLFPVAAFAAEQAAPGAAPAPQFVATLCGKGSFTQSRMREKLLREVLVHDSLRGALAKQVEIPGNACRAAVVDYLEKLQTNSKAEERYEGRFAFVALGVVARLPEAISVVQKEIAGGSGNEWLSALAALDGAAYLRTLRSFAASAASDIRKSQNLQATAGQAYSGGGLETGGQSSHEPVRIISPLVIDRYLRALLSGKIAPTPVDFASLNALFAGSNASYRQVFIDPLKQFVIAHTAQWIPAFRAEPAWVQFRLFPLMAAAGGPEMVRELMWLSNHHADAKIRLLASRTLDETLAKAK